MKMFDIDSQFRVGARLPEFDEIVVKNEPMFFSAKPSFAFDRGGPITRSFLRQASFNFAGASLDDKSMCFDSRVHMLMPGWFPCIPGWHHDDVPRSRSDGQPNYDDPGNTAKHILALVNGDICPTEFATGRCSYPEVPMFGENVYKVWHDIVEDDIEIGVLERHRAPSNHLIHFDHNTFHQGTRAVKKGWRWFGRLTWDAGYEKGRPHHNEIRRQVNVYLDNPTEGW